MTIRLKGSVWLYPGETANWHFVTIPKKETKRIDGKFKIHKRGWGSLPVLVKIGKTTWNTSIFPDGKTGTYLLPLKAPVRRKEGIEAGDIITFSISVGV